MSGKLAVDTNAVIAYREGIEAVCLFVDHADLVVVPAAVLGELLFGALNSAHRQKNEKAVKAFLSQSVLVPVDESIAARYAHIRHDLKKIGKPIPENDLWIAATCMELETGLLTADGHFDCVEGLKVIHWPVENAIPRRSS